MNISYLSVNEIPKSVRNRAGKYKHIVLGFISTGKDAMKVDFDSDKEAQSLVGFCHGSSGLKLGVEATQRGCTAYVWKKKEAES